MMKHLPEGLTPFEDCGFARTPCEPLERQPLWVSCRVDGSDAEPELLWRVNGAEQAPLAPERQDGRCYRFALGAFPFGTRIEYAFRAGDERTKPYETQTHREVELGMPRSLRRSGDTLALCYENGLTLRFTAGEQLRLHCGFGAAEGVAEGVAEGAEVERAELALPNGFALTVQKLDFACQLKRLSLVCLSLLPPRLLLGSDGRAVRLTLRWQWSPTHVWGTGERFDAVDQLGRGTNGRVVEKFTHQGEQTYLPIPFWMTDAGYGWWRQGSIPAETRFGDTLEMSRLLPPEGETDDTLFFGTPGELLAQFLRATGKPALPPDWSFGVWMSANGWNCDAEVDAQLRALREHGYPASVMVLEAWSDERTFYRWSEGFPDPAATVRRIREAGLHLVLWQIPIVKYEWDGEWGEALRADEREAIEQGYCVLNEDGTPYRVTENWFHNSLLLDFTNPRAVDWWFGKRKYLLDMGVEGFKTDGGEFLFDRAARLHDGTRGLAAHNLYPGQYVGAYHAFLRGHGVEGVTFSRAGFTGAQTQPMHWAGDQLSQWSELRAQLNAGLSAGLSGVLFWGFDIGGFAGELPTAELYLRATAMACFCPVMQWHAEPRDGQFYRSHERGFNNDRSPWNLAEKLHDPRVLELAAGYARLREGLLPYLLAEARACVALGRPLMAHLCIDFPNDATACATDDEYMLGRELLVAPIVSEGQAERRVYLPEGVWENWFTRERYAGRTTRIEACGLDAIPVYRRVNEGANACE